MSPRRWRVTVLGTCAAAAIVTTWPLALRLTSAVPLGTETAATIPLFDVWTLWWSGVRSWRGYAAAWDAPIFHPTPGAFALSEPLWLPGAMAAPLFAAGAPPALAHNLVLLALLTANGVGGARVARALGVARGPSLAAGALMVTLPIFAKLVGELPLVGAFGTLVALDGAIRFGRGGRTRHALAVGGGLVAQALCCEQLTLYAFIFVAAASMVSLAERGFRDKAALGRMGVAIGSAVALISALAYAPLSIHRRLGLTRSDDLVLSLSAQVSDFWTRPAHASLAFPPREATDHFTGGLFPGFLVLTLAAIGALVRAPETGGPAVRRWRWFAAAFALGGALLALGLNLSLAGFRPFSVLRALPGFGAIRSPFRAVALSQISLACLAAVGLDLVARRFRAQRYARHGALVLGLLAAVENLSVPAPLLPVPRTPGTAWTAFLAAQPPGTVVAHVPFPAGGDVSDLAIETRRMFAQIAHRQPLVNGYASNFPALNREFMFAMGSAFPSPLLACALHSVLGAELLSVDQAWLAGRREAFAVVTPLLTPIYSDRDVAIFRFTPPPGACPPLRIDLGPS